MSPSPFFPLPPAALTALVFFIPSFAFGDSRCSPPSVSCSCRGMGNCRPIHKQMLSVVCMRALQEGPHHALLVLLLNPEPSAEALDGWEGVEEGGGGSVGTEGAWFVKVGAKKDCNSFGLHFYYIIVWFKQIKTNMDTESLGK